MRFLNLNIFVNWAPLYVLIGSGSEQLDMQTSHALVPHSVLFDKVM